MKQIIHLREEKDNCSTIRVEVHMKTLLGAEFRHSIIFSFICLCSGDGASEQDDEDMDVEAAVQPDEVAQALIAADALGKSSKNITGTDFEDIADSLKELDMDNYDEDDDGIFIYIALCIFLPSYTITIKF